MKKFASSHLGVEQGNTEIFSDFANGGEMWTGRGPRVRRKEITFSESFRDPPAVHVSLSLWDMDQGTNLRADVAAEDVTTEGFSLVFRTWSDTRVARVRMNWMAVGAVEDDDRWQLY